MTQKSHQTDFTEGNILKPIALFSVPILVGDLFSSLYNIVDSIVVGQFVGSYALAAVNASFAVSMVCIAVYAAFGFGSSVIVGQFFGAKQKESTNRAVATAFVGALIIGSSMSVIGLLISRPVLRLINTPEDIFEPACLYLRITMVGCTPQLFYFMGSGILRGLGDSHHPMYFMTFCSLLNIILDVVLVAVFGMGCAGVALATVVSQACSSVLVVRQIVRGGLGVTITRKTLRLDGAMFRRILQIGIPKAIQQLVTSIGLLFIQSIANSFGTNMVAINGVIQKVDSFAMMPAMAVGQTASMFVAQNVGAGRRERARRGSTVVCGMVIVIDLLIGMVLFIVAAQIFRIFIKPSDPGFDEIVSVGRECIRILAFFYIVYGLQQALCAILQGAGAAQPVMLIAVAAIVVRVFLTYGMAMNTGIFQNMYWATNIYNTVFFIGLAIYFKFGHWQDYVRITPAKAVSGDI